MAGDTTIEWADATWNPIVGCQIVSPGCKHCYAMGQAARIERMAAGVGRATHYAGTTQPSKAGPVWTGKVALAGDDAIAAPIRWRRPRRIFVNSMGDLFAEGVTDAMRDRVWAVMACSPWHTFIVLTKRPAAMRAYVEALLGERLLAWAETPVQHQTGIRPLIELVDAAVLNGPLPNVWLGVTAEDQERADERVPWLLETPAAVRVLSYEPAIGPLDLRHVGDDCFDALRSFTEDEVVAQWGETFPGGQPRIDWVIVGGESGRGPNIRPMHPAWARQVRDDCAAAGVPFFFKQWGEWAPAKDVHAEAEQSAVNGEFHGGGDFIASCCCSEGDRDGDMRRVGKRAARGELDGVVHHALAGGARMITIDLLLATPLGILAIGALISIGQDVRIGDREGRNAGVVLFATWALPACALLAHAACRA